MAKSSFHFVSEDGTKVTCLALPEKGHCVTFSRRGDEDDFIDETCDFCPSLDSCLTKGQCVLGTACVTEALR